MQVVTSIGSLGLRRFAFRAGCESTETGRVDHRPRRTLHFISIQAIPAPPTVPEEPNVEAPLSEAAENRMFRIRRQPGQAV